MVRGMGTVLDNPKRLKNKWEAVAEPPLEVVPGSLPNSFAVVHICGAQHKVVAGDLLMTPPLNGCDIGNKIVFKKLMLVGTKDWTALGVPMLEGSVHATVEEQTLAQEILVFKFKRRKNYRRLNPVRTPYTLLRITGIEFDYEKYKTDQVLVARDPKLARPQLERNPNLFRTPEESKKIAEQWVKDHPEHA